MLSYICLACGLNSAKADLNHCTLDSCGLIERFIASQNLKRGGRGKGRGMILGLKWMGKIALHPENISSWEHQKKALSFNRFTDHSCIHCQPSNSKTREHHNEALIRHPLPPPPGKTANPGTAKPCPLNLSPYPPTSLQEQHNLGIVKPLKCLVSINKNGLTYVSLSVGMSRANKNPNPSSYLNEILQAHLHLFKEGFGASLTPLPCLGQGSLKA